MHTASTNFPQLLYKEEVDSTNRYLARLAMEQQLPNLFTVWADYQTAGRGQRETSWESEAGKNLTFSTLLYPKGVRANRQFLLSQSIAIAIQKVLSNYTEGITIKWPNDIYYHNRKICGVLIEHDLQGSWVEQTIAGIGINVNQESFLSNAPNPVSLYQLLGRQLDREKLLQELLEQIAQAPLWRTSNKEAMDELNPDWVIQLQESYFALQYRREGMHLFSDANGLFTARLVEVLPDGHLLLQDENGVVRSYGFKEVSYV